MVSKKPSENFGAIETFNSLQNNKPKKAKKDEKGIEA